MTYISKREFDDFASATADMVEELRNENKALKKKLSAFNNAEELLAKLTIATDQAKSSHDSMMIERKNSAEQSLQERKLREEQKAEYEARHRNAMEAMRRQTMRIYDSQAETQSMLEQIRNGQEEFERNRQSFQQHSEWMEANHTARREELERFAAKDYIDQQLTAREQQGLTPLQREYLDRSMRNLIDDPAAFVQRLQETLMPPAQPEPPNFDQ